MLKFKPVKHPITLYENTDHEDSLRFRDKYKNIVNLTGFTARMEIRTDVEDDGDPILLLTTENGGLVIDADLGKITIVISDVIEDYVGVYDLILFDPDDNKIKPIKTSAVKVVAGVTSLEA